MALTQTDAFSIVTKRLEEETAKNAAALKLKAPYKIQMWFISDRKAHGPCTYSLSFWESGMRLHGGGDEMMFICRRHADAPRVKPFEVTRLDMVGPDNIRGCGKLIPGGLSVSGMIGCPHCGVTHATDQIGDSIVYRTDIATAAKNLVRWWHTLEDKADIYLKFSPMDPRVILMAKTMGPRKARELKGLTIYPLERIIKDLSGGASVESRFKALLAA